MPAVSVSVPTKVTVIALSVSRSIDVTLVGFSVNVSVPATHVFSNESAPSPIFMIPDPDPNMMSES
jgi:hypothetical protein